MKDKKNQLQFKELELLQNIISRQEDIRLKLRSWYITLITALTITFISSGLNINKCEFWIAAFVLSVLFLWLEVVHRVAENRAIERSKEVEKSLRENSSYDGPLIGESLSIPNKLSEQCKALGNVRIYSTYLVVNIIVALIYFMK